MLSAVAWVVISRQPSMHDGMPLGFRERLTMGGGVLVFSALWVVMMVAMMFPAAVPMILTFARVQTNRRRSGKSFVPTALFILVYLAVWSVAGVVSFALATGAGALADAHHAGPKVVTRATGILVIAAGLYQLTRFKHRCLSKCRNPMHYVLGSWKDGIGGAILMGGEHALYCLGCCWLLFLILFPIGIMNVAVMGAVTALIFVEKVCRRGVIAARVVGVAFLAAGVAALVAPEHLPVTLMSGG